MPNVLLISSIAQSTSPCDARLAYQNDAETASQITASHDSANTGKLNDGLTTLAWRPAVSGATQVVARSEFAVSGSGDKFTGVTYIGVTGVNWQSSGTSISITDENDVEIAAASGYRDNQPLFVVIDESVFEEIKFKFNSANSNLEVGEIHFGPTIDFPRNVKVGYKPARWSNNAIVTNSNTEENQFGPSTVRARGSTEQFTIDYVTPDFMDNDYRNFINAARGRQVFFVWDKARQNHAVYGNWEASAPSFTQSRYSSINLTIRGVA